MKKLNILDKYYNQFTPIERLNLYLKARVREDYEESDKLIETCQRFQYVQRDLKFTHKFDRLLTIALLFMIEFQAANNKLELSEFITALLYEKIKIYEWFVELLENDSSKQEITNTVQKKMAEIVPSSSIAEAVTNRKLISLKTEIEAYKQFCSDVGLDADTVLKWLGNDVIALDDAVINDFNDVAPNDDYLIERKKQYQEVWNCHKDHAKMRG